jgi:hypothetical protein
MGKSIGSFSLKSTIFWDITTCSPLSVNRRFGGTYRLHLYGRKLSKKPAWKQLARMFEELQVSINKSTVFWDLTRCSPLSVNRRFGGTYRLHLHGRKNKLSNKPAWKHVASSDFQRTTRRYISEDGTLHNHRCENLKSYKFQFGKILSNLSRQIGSDILYFTSEQTWLTHRDFIAFSCREGDDIYYAILVYRRSDGGSTELYGGYKQCVPYTVYV